MTNDILSEMLVRIRNAVRIKRLIVRIPKTRMTQSLAEILLQEGLIEGITEDFSFRKTKSSLCSKADINTKSFICLYLKYYGRNRISVITNLQRLSRPGLRIYAKQKDIPQIMGGLGLVILSTSKGLMTDRKARQYELGGEVLCSIWLFLANNHKSSFVG
jgi:small subunit ribosomal protein S8